MSGIIKTEKNKNYSVISNEVARDNNLSARAKGIYFYLMTLPEDWKLYKSELYKHFKEGRDALNKAFTELENSGYITKERIKNVSGKFDGWNYTVFESKQQTDLLENRKSEKPKSVNPQLLNTDNILSTDNTNIVDFKDNQQKWSKYLDYWNTKQLRNHIHETAKAYIKKKHTDLLSLYEKENGDDSVFKAIDNYDIVVNSSLYYFYYKWNFWDFIIRGLSNFIENADPLNNYRSNKSSPVNQEDKLEAFKRAVEQHNKEVM